MTDLPRSPQDAEIVLVHGLWYHGIGMALMAKRLRAQGWRVRVFSYPTISQPFARNARALQKFALKSEARQQHFVGHSLGGLLILRMLQEFRLPLPGRVLLLGTPLDGSHVARRIGGQTLLRPALGRSAGVLYQGFDELPPERQVGMIAGNRPVGIGQITGRLLDANDGTVLVKETLHEQLDDHLLLPVTHTQLVLSARVVDSATHFLLFGNF